MEIQGDGDTDVGLASAEERPSEELENDEEEAKEEEEGCGREESVLFVYLPKGRSYGLGGRR